jgi:hypothetical protein
MSPEAAGPRGEQQKFRGLSVLDFDMLRIANDGMKAICKY